MKYIYALIILLVCGCSFDLNKIDNTPKKQVEKYLNEYQTLSDNVTMDLNFISEKEIRLNDKQKEEYIDIMKNNFKNMTYEIKDEMVNGNNSVVEVEIIVNNFSKAYKNCNPDDIDCKLDKMKKAKEKIKYLIYFNVNKDENNNWKVEDITETDEEKLLGIYEN